MGKTAPGLHIARESAPNGQLELNRLHFMRLLPPPAQVSTSGAYCLLSSMMENVVAEADASSAPSVSMVICCLLHGHLSHSL